MPALLLAVALIALIALTILALLVAGVVAAIVTGIALLNVLALLIGMRSKPADPTPSTPDGWRPRSFRRPAAPPLDPEADEQLQSHTLTVHRR